MTVVRSDEIKTKKVKNDAPKVPKQADAKQDSVINTQNYNLDQFFNHGKF